MTSALAIKTWPELTDRPMVIVPVGSTEQHGPHLPIETDTVIARAVATALADRVGAYVTPALAIGASGEHQGFPGVVSMGTSTLRTVLVEVVRSLSPWTGRVVLLNGHGGNVDALSAASRMLVADGHPVTWMTCMTNGDAHAGRTETSLMLHLAPRSVRLEQAEPGNTTPLRELMPALRAGGVRGVSSNGVLGDPTGATATEGCRIFETIVEEALRGL